MRIPDAPLHERGYRQARPGDVAGRDDLVLVDVREEIELLGELGHVHGVMHVPSAELLANGLSSVPKSAAVVVLCGDGRTSQKCAATLVELGYEDVYHLVGGMVRWTAEERPIARARTWR